MPLWDADNRLADDKCALLARLRDNEALSAYRFYDPYGRCTTPCTERQRMLSSFAARHPSMQYRDGFGMAPCDVDGDSALKHSSRWTNAKERQQLPKRVFTSAPDLARGSANTSTESALLSGEDTAALRQCSRLSELNFGRFDPNVDVQCAEHVVPPWTWGGASSRDITRSPEFLASIGYQSDPVCGFTCYRPDVAAEDPSGDAELLLG